MCPCRIAFNCSGEEEGGRKERRGKESERKRLEEERKTDCRISTSELEVQSIEHTHSLVGSLFPSSPSSLQLEMGRHFHLVLAPSVDAVKQPPVLILLLMRKKRNREERGKCHSSVNERVEREREEEHGNGKIARIWVRECVTEWKTVQMATVHASWPHHSSGRRGDVSFFLLSSPLYFHIMARSSMHQ